MQTFQNPRKWKKGLAPRSTTYIKRAQEATQTKQLYPTYGTHKGEAKFKKQLFKGIAKENIQREKAGFKQKLKRDLFHNS